LGEANTLTLHYASVTADATPIVRVGYEDIDTTSFSTFATNVLMAKLTVQIGSTAYVAPGYTGTDIPGLTGGEQFSAIPFGEGAAYASFQVDLRGQPTGLYGYTMLTGVFGFAGSRSAVAGSYATTNGRIGLVDHSASPFGSGWDLAGLETLYPAADGA